MGTRKKKRERFSGVVLLALLGVCIGAPAAQLFRGKNDPQPACVAMADLAMRLGQTCHATQKKVILTVQAMEQAGRTQKGALLAEALRQYRAQLGMLEDQANNTCKKEASVHAELERCSRLATISRRNHLN